MTVSWGQLKVFTYPEIKIDGFASRLDIVSSNRTLSARWKSKKCRHWTHTPSDLLVSAGLFFRFWPDATKSDQCRYPYAAVLHAPCYGACQQSAN
jgi:hypothetical protein